MLLSSVLSFAIGAQFAAAACKQVSLVSTSRLGNFYFAYTIIFLACVFAPFNAYLLHEFPSWMTMYGVGDFQFINGSSSVFVALSACGNSAFGCVGFFLSTVVAKRFNYQSLHRLWVTSYVIFFAMVGFGYRRLTFTGSLEDWHSRGGGESIGDFFVLEHGTSPVFCTLCVMGVVFVPGVFYPLFFWPREGGYGREEKWVHGYQILRCLIEAVSLTAAVYLLTLYYLGEGFQMRVSEGELLELGVYAPLAGFIVTVAVGFPAVLFPFFLLPAESMLHEDKEKVR